MSWAEVKKFLNKRTDKTLDELIDEKERNNSGGTKSVGVLGYTSAGSILKITGKGRLYNFHMGFSVKTGSRAVISLKVDGETVLSYDATCPAGGSTSTAYYTVTMLSIGKNTPIDSSNYYVGFCGETIKSIRPAKYISMDEHVKTDYGDKKIGVYIPDYIQFDESVEITATINSEWYNASTNNNAGLTYKLD